MALGHGMGRIGLMALCGLALAACTKEVILEGERFDPRTDLSASIPTEANPAPQAPPARPENRAAPISLPAAQSLAGWPQRGGTARHDSPHGALSGAPVLVWSADIGAGNSRQNRIAATPIVDGGRVFAMDAQARLTAVTMAGALAWQADLVPDYDQNSDISGGGLSADGGRVFAATGYGEIVALDAASGQILWRQRLDSAAQGAPLAAGGRVYAGARDGSAWALSASDGRILWTATGTQAQTGMIGAAAPALGDGRVYFPSATGDVAALGTDGTPVWSGALAGARAGRAYGAITDLTGDPVLSGGVLYLGSASGKTAALDAATGARLWTADEGAMGAPLVVGGSVFVVSDEARLVRLDRASGAAIWSVEMPYFVKDTPKKRKGIHAHFGPVLAGGRVAVVSSDGLLRLFDPRDGALVATAEIPGGAAAAPALAGGQMFVVSARGQLLAFR